MTAELLECHQQFVAKHAAGKFGAAQISRWVECERGGVPKLVTELENHDEPSVARSWCERLSLTSSVCNDPKAPSLLTKRMARHLVFAFSVARIWTRATELHHPMKDEMCRT
jgi:hypothetical protein